MQKLNYEKAVEYIHSRPRMKKADNHAAIKELLDRLDNPQDRLNFIHIAGTNGKGSTSAMLANVLATAGYKVGLNISPFVIEFTERFSINGIYIPKETLAEITTKIKYYQEQILKEYNLNLVEFEIVTAIAFAYFEMEKCDLVCLEVGIGGRLDTTNVIKDSLISCIMNISYDHTEILGSTLTEIATEKAGIIKENQTVVLYPNLEEDAKEAILKVAKEKNSNVVIPDINQIKSCIIKPLKTKLTYKNFEIEQSFTGIHQSYNAVVVIECINALNNLGYNISVESIIKGIQTTKFPARIEVIKEEPLIILDGAHNIDGVSALTKVLKDNEIYNLTAIWATLADKQPENVIKEIAPHIDTLYTVDLYGPRAVSKEDLMQFARNYIVNVATANSVEDAINLAMQNNKNGVLVFGSLYLASDARKFLI